MTIRVVVAFSATFSPAYSDICCNHTREHYARAASATYSKEKPTARSCRFEFNGAPGPIRTADTRFRRAVLYPLSYEGMWDILLT